MIGTWKRSQKDKSQIDPDDRHVRQPSQRTDGETVLREHLHPSSFEPPSDSPVASDRADHSVLLQDEKIDPSLITSSFNARHPVV